MGKLLDLTGNIYGRLHVQCRVNTKGRSQWLCKCSCGNEGVIVGTYLTQKRSPVRSCGCLQKEAASKAKTTHGRSNERLYNIWRGMRVRCAGNNRRDATYYKDKGIKVCQEWDDYSNFRGWAMANGYSEELTIERKDTRKGYTPFNCVWVTSGDQTRNRGLYSTNKTGVSGVVRLEPQKGTKRSPSYAAIWSEDGKPRKRSFSIAKYGEEEAFLKALTIRKQKVQELVDKGVYYGDMHHICDYNNGQEVVNGAFFGVDNEGVEYSGILGFNSVPAQKMMIHTREDSIGRNTIKRNINIQVADGY